MREACRPFGWGLLALLAFSGCGPGSQEKAQKPPPPPPTPVEEGKVAIAADQSQIIHKDEKGQVILEVDSESSVTQLNREVREDVQSVLNTVSGRLFEKGKLASRFASPKGSFDRKTKILKLDQGVRVTSETRGLVLTAQKITWSDATNLIVAEGGVWIRGEQFESGPAPRLVTTPDLRRFGTPDRFKP